MSKRNKGFEVVDHAKYLQRIATAKRLGVSSKLFENKRYEQDLEEDNLDEMTTYGDGAEQEVGHEAKQGRQKPMQSIDDTTGVQAGSQDPGLRKKGPNTHKEKGMLEETEELEEGYGAEMYADVPEGASWEEVKETLEKAYKFYSGRRGRLNQSLAMQMKQALAAHMKTQREDAPAPEMGAPLNEAVSRLIKSIAKYRKEKGNK